MTQMKQEVPEGEDRYATLLNNAGAIRAICSAVEGTLGPKGLDTMLVGAHGEVMITNDGVTILEKMDVTHPAARLMIQVARSQQLEVGDGTTTATVLAGALVNEGVAQVMKGVPVAKVVSGIQEGVRLAVISLRSRSREVESLSDPMLYKIAYIAGREQEDIAELVIRAAEVIGLVQLQSDSFRFSETISALEKGRNEVWPGLLINRKPLSEANELSSGHFVLVLQDPLQPETIDEEALGTEAGFQANQQLQSQFRKQLENLVLLQVGLIVLDRGIDAEAEQFCADHGIMVLQRVSRRDLLRICEFCGAKPIRRAGFNKTMEDFSKYLGIAKLIRYDESLEQVRIAEGAGRPAVTVAVGANTREVGGERSRMAMDAAAAVQAAVRGGYLPGGGSAEMAVARELDRYRESVKGMEGFGVAAVAQSLRKPLAQIVVNAGFNPLEKVEEVKAAQFAHGSDALGIDCDSGALIDCLAAGIIDPTPVKVHAIQAAGEVAAALLRIHTVIKMKSGLTEDRP